MLTLLKFLMYDIHIPFNVCLRCIDDKNYFGFQVWPLSQKSRAKYLNSGSFFVHGLPKVCRYQQWFRTAAMTFDCKSQGQNTHFIISLNCLLCKDF